MASPIKKLSSLKEIKANEELNSVEGMFSYYVNACNEGIVGEKIYYCPKDMVEILHLYSISDSLYRFNYFFNLSISLSQLAIILAAILQ